MKVHGEAGIRILVLINIRRASLGSVFGSAGISLKLEECFRKQRRRLSRKQQIYLGLLLQAQVESTVEEEGKEIPTRISLPAERAWVGQRNCSGCIFIILKIKMTRSSLSVL